MFFKSIFWYLPKMLARIQNHIWIDFCLRIPKLVLNIILHKQMTEQLSFEVDVRNGQKSEKVHFLKCIFVLQKYYGPPKLLPHVKIKS